MDIIALPIGFQYFTRLEAGKRECKKCKVVMNRAAETPGIESSQFIICIGLS
jgi:hypothetical protein